MKKIALAVLTTALLAACATSDDEPPARRPGGMGGRMPMRPNPEAAGILGLLPPPNWWHDPQISAAVKLSDAQFAELDKIGAGSAEADKLRAGVQSAERDLRALLITEHPTADEINVAGARVRTLQDEVVDHDVHTLAGERALLTREQWTALQDQLRGSQRDDFGGRRGGYGGPGGRGGRGRGRWPGM